MSEPRVLIAAGGTGGHVFPALAVAHELRRQGWHAEWVGTDRGLESRVIPQSGIALHVLRFSGLRGKGLAAWLSLPLRLMRAFSDALSIVRRAQPGVVVAFGGYVTFPVGLAAKRLGLPLCVHEQNAVMGTANRWLARFAKPVMLSFPGTRYAPRHAVITGNPVREDISGLAGPESRYAARANSPLHLLVVGGSLGAQALNQALPNILGQAQSRGLKAEVWHQTGERDLAQVQASYQTAGLPAQCTAFIDDMAAAFAWADLVICRAGASTVCEVAAAGVAALFVPLPSAIDDHQTANARFLVDRQAAWLMPQASLGDPAIVQLLSDMSRAELLDRAVKARAAIAPDAVSQVAQWVARAAQSGRLDQAAPVKGEDRS